MKTGIEKQSMIMMVGKSLLNGKTWTCTGLAIRVRKYEVSYVFRAKNEGYGAFRTLCLWVFPYRYLAELPGVPEKKEGTEHG